MLSLAPRTPCTCRLCACFRRSIQKSRYSNITRPGKNGHKQQQTRVGSHPKVDTRDGEDTHTRVTAPEPTRGVSGRLCGACLTPVALAVLLKSMHGCGNTFAVLVCRTAMLYVMLLALLRVSFLEVFIVGIDFDRRLTPFSAC